MKTTRIRQWIIDYFLSCGNEERSTNQILDHINEKSRLGSSNQALGNILAHDKRIERVREIKVKRTKTSYQLEYTWRINKDVFISCEKDEVVEKKEYEYRAKKDMTFYNLVKFSKQNG